MRHQWTKPLYLSEKITWEFRCPRIIHRFLSSHEQQQKRKIAPYPVERKWKVSGREECAVWCENSVLIPDAKHLPLCVCVYVCVRACVELLDLVREKHLQNCAKPITDPSCLNWQLWEHPQEAWDPGRKSVGVHPVGIDKSQSRAMGTSSEQTCKYSFASQSLNCLFRDFFVICCFYLAFTEQKKDLRKKKNEIKTLDVFFIAWCELISFVCGTTACFFTLKWRNVIAHLLLPLSLLLSHTQLIQAVLAQSCP